MFLNSLLYTACLNQIYRTAIYPGISYFHEPHERRFSLALDISEPFKPIMVDRLIFRLFNQKRITKKDFRSGSKSVLLKPESKKKVLKEWDNLLSKTVQYPEFNRSVSYRQLIRITVYSLIKSLLSGEKFQAYKVNY